MCNMGIQRERARQRWSIMSMLQNISNTISFVFMSVKHMNYFVASYTHFYFGGTQILSAALHFYHTERAAQL